LQAKLSQDTIDAARTNLKVSLTQFLRNNLTGNIGIQKAITHHLADDFLGPPIVRLGTPLMVNQASGTMFVKQSAELKVPLTTESKLGGDTGRAVRTTFSFDQHGEFQRNFVIWINGQRTMGTNEGFLRYLELHRQHLLRR
jgi:hypothetical protein